MKRGRERGCDTCANERERERESLNERVWERNKETEKARVAGQGLDARPATERTSNQRRRYVYEWPYTLARRRQTESERVPSVCRTRSNRRIRATRSASSGLGYITAGVQSGARLPLVFQGISMVPLVRTRFRLSTEWINRFRWWTTTFLHVCPFRRWWNYWLESYFQNFSTKVHFMLLALWYFA